jgi:hypothetical protein
MSDSVDTINTNIQAMAAQYTTNQEILAECDGESTYDDDDGNVYDCSTANMKNLTDTNEQLFKNLYTNYQILTDANAKSTVAYVNQSAASKIFADMNANTENVIDSLEKVEDDKLRMVQINDYYSKRYDAETAIVKKVIIVLVVFLILSILSYKKIIPTKIAAVICGILLFVTAFIIYTGHTDIESRDKLYFDEYDWGPNTPISTFDPSSCNLKAEYCYVADDGGTNDGKYVHCKSSGGVATSTGECDNPSANEELCTGEAGVNFNIISGDTKSTCDAFTTLGGSSSGSVVKSPFPLQSPPAFESATSYATP